MLKIDQNERASLDDIINSDWISNYGKDHIVLDLDQHHETPHVSDFGNIGRLMTTSQMKRGRSQKNLQAIT
jgi:hypothetical protein